MLSESAKQEDTSIESMPKRPTHRQESSKHIHMLSESAKQEDTSIRSLLLPALG